MLLDNQGAISLIKNNQVNSKIKYIDIEYMFIREAHSNKQITVEFVPSERQQADILTKNLGKGTYQNLRRMMGLKFQDNICETSPPVLYGTNNQYRYIVV